MPWIIEEESTPIISTKPTTGQELKGIPVQAARGAEDFANLLGSLFGEPSMPGYQPKVDLETPEFRGASNYLQQQLGVPEEALNPTGLITGGLQRFARGSIPAAITGGVLGGIPGILSALETTGVGSVAATGAKAFGAPEYVQDITQLGTELGYGIKRGILPSVKQAQKTEDQLARAAVKNLEAYGADSVTNAMAQVASKLETETNSTLADKIRKAFETIEKNIVGGKLNPVNAMDLRKSLYKLGGKLSPDEAANYIEPLTKSINEFFTTTMAHNPKFYKHLTSRDKLTALRHMNTYLEKGINNLDLAKIPIVGKAANAFLGRIARDSEKFVRGVATNSAARKVYFNIAKGVAQNDPDLIVKNINILTHVMPESKETVRNEWIIED